MSGEKDLFELILVRWNVTEHWSPWNCILLTTDEARAHVKLDDPEKVASITCMHDNKIKVLIMHCYLSECSLNHFLSFIVLLFLPGISLFSMYIFGIIPFFV